LYTAVGRDIPGFWFHATYTSNIYFAYFTDDFVTTWAHFWSLAVEEQFYILFAPLIIFSRSVYTGVLCLAVVLVSLIVRFVLAETAVLPYVVYIDSMVNFGLLALGGILYLYRERLARWLRIGSSTSSVPILLVLAVYLLSIAFTARFSASDGAVRQLLYVISVAIGALLLFQIYSSQGSAVVRALEWKPWVHYGRMSYGFYLYNSYVPNDLPVRLLDMAARRGPSALRPAFSGLIDAISASGLLQDAAAVLGFVVCFAVTFAITQASWTLIEQPALGWRARLPQLRLRSAPPAPVADSER
jgi:peptidoglycan/LPS O-acetylase OafA/YrhL